MNTELWCNDDWSDGNDIKGGGQDIFKDDDVVLLGCNAMYNLVGRYQSFGEAYCRHLQG